MVFPGVRRAAFYGWPTGGMHPLWLNVFRLLNTTPIMAVNPFGNPKNRARDFENDKRAFLISALAARFLPAF
jgi:hypothetical protein